MAEEEASDEPPQSGQPEQSGRLGSFSVTLPGGLAVSGTGVIGLTAAVVLVLLGALLVPRALASDAIYTEPIQTPGTNGNPFMPSVGKDQGSVTAPPGTSGTFTGSTSGLYGGSLNNSTCDRQAMIQFLQAHSDKGAAWAAVQGIAQTDLAGYVSGLTPVLLRSDTSVTNHGFSDGRATTLHSVLQAGTAVLVDKYGTPRARCYCGNPLTPPAPPAKKRYVGPTWSGFSPASITTIKPAATEITEFTLVNPRTNEVLYRLAGTAGEHDRPQTPLPPPSIPEISPPVPSVTPESRPQPQPETLPPPRPRPLPDPQPQPLPPPRPNTVPSGFIGTWSGSVIQDDYAQSPYPITVHITGGKIGEKVASGEYPTLECQVHWTLKQVGSNEIVIRETVDDGPECLNVDVTLTLLAGGTMRYIFDGGLGRSVLERVS